MQRYFTSKQQLSASDIHHIKHVMRMKKGDEFQIVSDGKVYLTCIDSVEPFLTHIVEELPEKNDKFPNVVLIIPLLKEQKMDFILQKGTEIGVHKFIIAPFERAITKYDERKEKVKLERWQKICKEASEQSMRVTIPEVMIAHTMPFLHDIDALKLICSTDEHDYHIKHALKNNRQYDTIALVIGPEGGLTPKEEEILVQNEFKRVTLGSQILRVETVPLFLASIIRYEYTE